MQPEKSDPKQPSSPFLRVGQDLRAVGWYKALPV